MYQLSQITSIHIELTSKCNASCPMCLRNVLGGKANPLLPLTELSREDIRSILPAYLVGRLNKIFFCGNYGDPIMASDTLEIIQDLRALNSKMRIELHTNGSARSSNWWSQLARSSTKVIFGIDGLEDTNHLYRRGTKWSVIMRNAQAFIESGGSAEWTFIVFKHNEHQVEEAKRLSKSLGFQKFNIKKTGRFFSNIKAKGKDAQEVLNSNGETEYFIEKPLNKEYINPALAKEASLQQKVGDLKTYFGQTDIECKVLNDLSFYISAEGYVFPCCWTANQLYPWYYPKEGSQIWKIIKTLPEGLDTINAKKRPLAEILDDQFFKKDIPGNWEKRSLKEGRLFVCGKTCGKQFDPFSAQFQ